MEYKRFLKTDWKAKWIWLKGEEARKNTWMCFNKEISIDDTPSELIAHIAAENKYWLYINGICVVREGGLKRGPSPTGCYYDEVDVAGFLRSGTNFISVLVWYWGNEASYSSSDAGQGGLLFEACGENISIISDSSWSVKINPAFKEDTGKLQPNYRIPESNVLYNACDEIEWNHDFYDYSDWDNASEYAVGGEGCWGETYLRDIPMFKDYGLMDYVNSEKYEGKSYRFKKKITLNVPYNAQLTPYLEVEAKKGKKIVITTENTKIGSVHCSYVTKDGVQSFESPAWFNGQFITYEIPAGVKIISLKYRESGYDTDFDGNFSCDNNDMNTLWRKSLRTLYITMRDNYMDCPDRERAQWWGDVTNEMMLSVYALSPSAYNLYRKGVSTMLAYVEPDTKVLQTVVPIKGDYFELPPQQLAGVCGFWNYYMYTGDVEFLKQVYSASVDYIELWEFQDCGLVEHRGGSWDWFDWGNKVDEAPLENAWYYYALNCVKSMAEILGDTDRVLDYDLKMQKLYSAYQTMWTGYGYKSLSNDGYDDRGNAVAVLSGLCPVCNFDEIKNLLFHVRNSSPYMEYYVQEALCRMGEFSLVEKRMCERYKAMIEEDYSTLWENWEKDEGTSNHAWSGGSLVIMSRHIAGIKPLEAGYERFEVKPQYKLHNSISCVVPTVKGLIKFEYSNVGAERFVCLDYPEGLKAEIYLPENAHVIINGKAFIGNFDSVAGKILV